MGARSYHADMRGAVRCGGGGSCEQCLGQALMRGARADRPEIPSSAVLARVPSKSAPCRVCPRQAGLRARVGRQVAGAGDTSELPGRSSEAVRTMTRLAERLTLRRSCPRLELESK